MWLILALVLPAGVFFVYSFWTTDLFGVHQTWTWSQYTTTFGNGFYRGVLASTIESAALISVACVTLAYGTAYALTFSVKRWGGSVLLVME